MRADAPYKTIDDIVKAKEPPKCGDQGTSGSGYQMSKLLEETLGAKFNMVLGYPGGSEIDLAIEKGEVVCRASTIPTHFSREPFLTWHRNKFDRHLVQTGRKRDPRAPDTPTIYELMDQYKTPQASRRTAQVLLASPEFGYPMIAPPGTPPELVKILREAYASIVKDPEFVAEVKKLRLDLDPSTGEELEALAKEVLDQPSEVVERVRKLSKN
jgi:tripartite-type tricarboxylate transporter receptor subunit TctC